MSAVGESESEGTVFRRFQNAEDRGAVAGVGSLVLAFEDGVEVGQDRARVRVVDGGGAQCVAGERGEGRGLGFFAADVAEEERPSAVVEGEQVVEVAAHFVGGSRVVGGGRAEAGNLGQGGWQEGAREAFGCGAHLLFGGDCANGRQAHLQLVHHQGGQVLEGRQLLRGHLAGLGVEHVDGAQVVAVGGGDGGGWGAEDPGGESGHLVERSIRRGVQDLVQVHCGQAPFLIGGPRRRARVQGTPRHRHCRPPVTVPRARLRGDCPILRIAPPNTD